MRTCTAPFSITTNPGGANCFEFVATGSRNASNGLICGNTGEIISPRRALFSDASDGAVLIDQDTLLTITTFPEFASDFVPFEGGLYVPSTKEFWVLRNGKLTVVEAIAPYTKTMDYSFPDPYVGATTICHNTTNNTVVYVWGPYDELGSYNYKFTAWDIDTKMIVSDVSIGYATNAYTPVDLRYSPFTNCYYLAIDFDVKIFNSSFAEIGAITLPDYVTAHNISNVSNTLYVFSAPICVNAYDLANGNALIKNFPFSAAPIMHGGIDINEAGNRMAIPILTWPDTTSKIYLVNAETNEEICNVPSHSFNQINTAKFGTNRYFTIDAGGSTFDAYSY